MLPCCPKTDAWSHIAETLLLAAPGSRAPHPRVGSLGPQDLKCLCRIFPCPIQPALNTWPVVSTTGCHPQWAWRRVGRGAGAPGCPDAGSRARRVRTLSLGWGSLEREQATVGVRKTARGRLRRGRPPRRRPALHGTLLGRGAPRPRTDRHPLSLCLPAPRTHMDHDREERAWPCVQSHGGWGHLSHVKGR